jgi:uncharacterized protein YjbI with pentapeptide repeats
MTPADRRRARVAAVPVPPRLPTLRAARLPDDDIADEVLLTGLDYRGVDLSARAAALVDVEGCRFTDSSLAGSRLDKVTLLDVVLERCDLANTVLGHGSLTRVLLDGCRTTGLVASGLLLRNTTFRDCIVDLGVFRFATFETVEFVDCRLVGADFVSANIGAARFRRCDLTRVDLSQVSAKGALFVDCTWDGVRGVSNLAGATVAHGSPLDAEAFMVATASSLGIRLADPADHPDPPL